MSRSFLTKTSFTAGELDPLLRGRLDLKAQEDGAARLRNVVVHPSGGVSRRPGLRYLATLPGALRLVAFDGPDGGQLVAFGAHRVDILVDAGVVASFPDTLWGPSEIPDLSTARWGDRLLIWDQTLPRGRHRGSEVDFSNAARTLDVTGGSIRQIVIHALMAAAGGDGVVRPCQLEDAARTELRRLGTHSALANLPGLFTGEPQSRAA